MTWRWRSTTHRLPQRWSRNITRLVKNLDDLELRSLLGGEFDRANAFVTIHSGAGGTESCDWADMLLRMYQRWIERHGFTPQIVDIQEGDEAGIKSVTVQVQGDFAYGYLQTERGVHRLVRISPFRFQQAAPYFLRQHGRRAGDGG